MGDRIKFTGISGNFSIVKTDIPAGDKTITFSFIACTDGDNISYPVVEIGTQVWMAENLKTTKFKDGSTLIPNVTEAAPWGTLTTTGYCWYGNNLANKDIYGALYNWYTVSTGNLCPTGWHVPTDVDWHTLVLTLDPSAVLSITESNIAGGKLKETSITHWRSTNFGATNESGFTALPGGYRGLMGGAFDLIGYIGPWWSSTGNNTSNAWAWYVDNSTTGVYRSGNHPKTYGYSVRCVRD